MRTTVEGALPKLEGALPKLEGALSKLEVEGVLRPPRAGLNVGGILFRSNSIRCWGCIWGVVATCVA